MSYASMLVLELQNMVRALAYDIADDGQTVKLHARIESEDCVWSASTDISTETADAQIRALLARAIESHHGPRFRFVVFADTDQQDPNLRRSRTVILAGTGP